MTYSRRFRFADWPNAEVPTSTAGAYVIWERDRLIYCGMSGRQLNHPDAAIGKQCGLLTRLNSHASGRLSGDQFCVYVANRLIVPDLALEDLPKFRSGDVSLDKLTRQYIRERLEYQFACVASGKEAFALERECRSGKTFGVRPLLNPGRHDGADDAGVGQLTPGRVD